MNVRLASGIWDPRRRAIVQGDTEVPLTPMEAKLLTWFLERPGELVDVRRLVTEVWGWSERSETRTVYATVNRLRDKIELDPRHPQHLVAPKGGGYRFELPTGTPSVPAARDRFVGRAAEIAAISARLAEGARLVTLLGGGGVGKTRLAEVWATNAGDVVWCDLTEQQTAEGVVGAVARALGVRLTSSGGDEIGFALRARGATTLLLDNVEQVVTPLVPVLERWLDTIPGLRVLATSRVSLGVRGEHLLPVEPLSLPRAEDDGDALALFLVRVQERDPGFVLQDRETAVWITAQLEGVPLLLELAAARVRTLGLSGLWRGLRQGDDLPVDPERPVRHRSVAAVVDWTWSLLTEEERADLTALSLFRGEFDLDAVLGVLEGPDLDLRLGRLCDWCVVGVRHTRGGDRSVSGDEPRYRLPVAFRERLDGVAGPEVRARYRAWVVSLDPGPEALLVGMPDEWPVRVRLRRAVEDVLYLAHEAVREGHTDRARAVHAAWAIMSFDGPFVAARRLVDAALDGPEADDRALLLEIRAQIQTLLGDMPAGLADIDAALACLDATERPSVRARLLRYRSGILGHSRRYAEAMAAFEEGAALADGALAAVLRADHAFVLLQTGRAADAAAILTETERALRELGHERTAGLRCINLAIALARCGRSEEALAAYEEALRVARRYENRAIEAIALSNVAAVRLDVGDAEGSLAGRREAIVLARRVGNRRTEAVAHQGLAATLQGIGRISEAEAEIEEALAAHRDLGAAAPPNVYAVLAEVRVSRGDLAGAEAALLEGDRSGPRGVDGWLAAARIALARGDAGEARRVLGACSTEGLNRSWAFNLALARAEVARALGEDPGPLLAEARQIAGEAVEREGTWQRAWYRRVAVPTP